ncbi:MAG: hypothetical protein ACLR07_05265 [Christensenellales bacterium]
MAKLEAYDKTLDYSYAPGIFPATECLKNAKKRCMRLLVSSNGLQSEGVQALEKAAQEADIRVEVADRALERISKRKTALRRWFIKKRKAGLTRTARISCSIIPATAAIWARFCARRSALG